MMLIVVEVADPLWWTVTRKLLPLLCFAAGCLLMLAFLHWKGNR